jgi:carbonic anhydrase
MLIGFLLLASGPAYAAAAVLWGYSGSEGPENWVRLTPNYSSCCAKKQSPIDLAGFIESDLKPIRFAYRGGGSELINNGDAVQMNYAPRSTIEVDGHAFELKQFHFHALSDNHISGRSFPIEAHLVHGEKDGNLAVVAVMLQEGAPNQALEAAWAKVPKIGGGKHALTEALSAESLLPANRDYDRFNGSLTTPLGDALSRVGVGRKNEAVATVRKRKADAFALLNGLADV